MGTNSSKSKGSQAGQSYSPRDNVDSEAGEKISGQARLAQSTRLPALDSAVIRILESFLTEQKITEIVLQRYGIREMPEAGVLLKPLRLEPMTTLSLDYNQLQSIPDCLALQPNITKVTLSHNCFSSTPSLGNTVTWLDLSWNSITVVDENVSQLVMLRRLDLRHNRLGPRSLPDLSDLSFLEYLDISENALTSWPRLSANCPLKVLKVGYNAELGDPADSAGPFPQLEHFSCVYTRVKIFPKFLLQSNEHLRTLDLSNTLISRLPMSMSFPKLSAIALSATKFVPSSETSAEIQDPKWTPPETISDEVHASLKGLHALSATSTIELNGVGLFHLPDSLFTDRPLTRLYLRWNNLFTIPDALLNLLTLECLDLLGNKLTEIPPAISRLSGLRHLSLGHNRLTTLPLEITHLTKLENLVLEHNLWEDPALESLYWSTDGVAAIMERIRTNDRSPVGVKDAKVLPALEGTPEEQMKDRVMGVIFGQALGDAVGLCSEFLMHTQATYTCPTDGIDLEKMHRDRHRIRWLQGDWTDDTDQAILLLENLLFRCDPTRQLDVCAFGKDLLQWAEYGFPELGDNGGMGIGQTVARVLNHAVFLTDPKLAAFTIWKDSGCSLAANGALMRCAPAALFGFWQQADPEEVDMDARLVMDSKMIARIPAIGDDVSSIGKNANIARMNTLNSCLVTHSDPRCIASCLSLNMALCAILRGETNVESILQVAFAEGNHIFAVPPADGVKHLDKYKEWSADLKRVIFDDNLAQLDLSDATTMGYTYKCLGSAFAVFRTSNSFEQSILKITSLGGDADTNAAVAGALLGAKLGFKALPQHWLQSLPHREWLQVRADKAWEQIQSALFKSTPVAPTQTEN